MKSRLLILSLLLSTGLTACATPGGGITLPGLAPRSSLDLPVNSVEKWDATTSKGDKSEITTVKTSDREFRFDGKFPSSFFGIPVEATVAGTITYQADGTAVLRYTRPLPSTVRAIYTFTNNGNTLELTTTGSEPALAAVGEKTILQRKDVTSPGS